MAVFAITSVLPWMLVHDYICYFGYNIQQDALALLSTDHSVENKDVCAERAALSGEDRGDSKLGKAWPKMTAYK